MTYALVLAAILWLVLRALPWRPAATREHLDALPQAANADLTDVTVLIPARNEAAMLPATLAALRAQGTGLRIVVIDDQSTDDTAECARAWGGKNLQVISGQPLPEGWIGKLWALEQGRRTVNTPLALLLDADIVLAPGIIDTLRQKLLGENLAMVSLMAELRMQTAWERWLMPAFVYFFKLIYPFSLANRPGARVAAAAGGCVLLRADALGAIGGFGAIRGELIDDCRLARAIKRSGLRIWLGLTHSVRSQRAYTSFNAIRTMVERCAFTQLGYSTSLLLILTGAFALAFIVPVVSIVWPPNPPSMLVALIAFTAMATSYVPTLRYYGRSIAWAPTLPVIALLYLAMTWSSAIGYWAGRRSCWKGRIYPRNVITDGR